MTDQIDGLRKEVHEMRGDFKDLGSKIANLTEVIIRKEESDKYLAAQVEKMSSELSDLEKRLRIVEDYVTSSKPIVGLAWKVVCGVSLAGALVFFGFKNMAG